MSQDETEEGLLQGKRNSTSDSFERMILSLFLEHSKIFFSREKPIQET